jgi:uncharacterized protein (DUF2336 family)
MSELHFRLDELQTALKSRNAHERQAAIKRIADYFVVGSRRFSQEQVTLFDDVFLRLTSEIEAKALARLAEQLAPLPDAPPRTIRSLAFNDAIEVAAPILVASPQLATRDLVANARTKSQAHLLAIAQRAELCEAVTDVLVDRGDRQVVRSVAGNEGARFSDHGFEKLVDRARRDDTLAHTVGTRRDIPRRHFLRLLASASAAVRARLEAAIPEERALITDTVAEIAGDIGRASREGSREHLRVKKNMKFCYRLNQSSEARIHAPAAAGDFEKTVVTLSMHGRFPVELVERALIDEGIDMILILAKAAGLARATVRALLFMNAGERGLPEKDLERALASYDRLSGRTAKRILAFYEKRRAKGTRRDASSPAETTEAIAV